MNLPRELFERIMSEVGFEACCATAMWNRPDRERCVYELESMSEIEQPILVSALREYFGAIYGRMVRAKRQHLLICLNPDTPFERGIV